MFIVVCTACRDCGSCQAVGLFPNKPTDDEVRKVNDSIGGMWCIRIKTYELSEGEIVINEDEE